MIPTLQSQAQVSPLHSPARRPTGSWFGALMALAILVSGVAPIRAQRPGEGSEQHLLALRQMDARKRYQAARVQRYEAYRGFQFVDRRSESGIAFEHHAVDDAGRTYQAAHYDHGNGLAVADVDGDGRLDLYFTTQLGSNALWRAIAPGKFEDFTAAAGVGMPDQISVGAAFGDLDNDGDPDLVVTTVRHGNRLFENLGGGRFRDITASAGLEYSGHSSGVVLFDFDGDGRLDIFVANVGSYTEEAKGPGGYFLARRDAFQGHLFPERTEFSLLYRNLGALHFAEVSREVGLRDGSWSGDATFADLNSDGFPDLYVVNMQGDDHFYENRAGHGFEDRTAAFFPKTPWGAMGVKFFDYNLDGRMDLFVTDMHSDMTQGQTEQALGFRPEVEKAKSEAFCSVQWPDSYYQGASNNIFGNAFYENLGDGRWKEVSETLGVETYWPWGVSVGDLNADGFEDLVVTAGMGYPFRYAMNSVLLNEQGKTFFDAEFVLGVEPRAGRRTEKSWFSLDCGGSDRTNALCGGVTGTTNILGTLSSRSSAILDLDGDGDLDLVTLDFNDRPQILFSNLSEKRAVHWFGVRLEGRKSNRDGLCATVRVRAGGRTQTRFHDGKSGYLAQSAMPLYFGLGEAAGVDEIEVRWPSGRRQVVRDLGRADRGIVLVEPAGEAGERK